MVADDAGWSQPLKIGVAAFVSAIGGALFSSLVTFPVQVSEMESELRVTQAHLEGKIELMRSVQIELRDQQKQNIATIASLSTRITQIEARTRTGADGTADPAWLELRQAQTGGE